MDLSSVCSSMSVFTLEDNDGLFSPPRVPSLKLTRDQKDKLDDLLQQSRESNASFEATVEQIYHYVFDRTFLLSKHMLKECLKVSANLDFSMLSKHNPEETSYID